MTYLQVSPLEGSREETWRGQGIRKLSVSWNLQQRFWTKKNTEPPTAKTIRTLLTFTCKSSVSTGALYLYNIYIILYTKWVYFLPFSLNCRYFANVVDMEYVM
jgi:hypothetical protein